MVLHAACPPVGGMDTRSGGAVQWPGVCGMHMNIAADVVLQIILCNNDGHYYTPLEQERCVLDGAKKGGEPVN